MHHRSAAVAFLVGSCLSSVSGSTSVNVDAAFVANPGSSTRTHSRSQNSKSTSTSTDTMLNLSSDASSSSSKSESARFQGRGAADRSASAPSLLEQPNGQINRELAERLYKWEHNKASSAAVNSASASAASSPSTGSSDGGAANIEDLLFTPNRATRARTTRGASTTFSTRQGLRLVQELVAECTSPSASEEDLIQEGIIALMQAKAEYNAGFEAFARHYIRSALSKGGMAGMSPRTSNTRSSASMLDGATSSAASKEPIVRPLSVESTMVEMPQVGSTLEETSSAEKFYRPVADDDDNTRGGASRGGSASRNKQTSSSAASNSDSLEYIDPMLQYEGEDTMWIHQQRVTGMLGEMIPDPSSDENDVDERLQALLSSTTTLTSQEKGIISMVYGIQVGASSMAFAPMSAAEIATMLDMPKQQVRTLQSSALHKLREQAAQE